MVMVMEVVMLVVLVVMEVEVMLVVMLVVMVMLVMLVMLRVAIVMVVWEAVIVMCVSVGTRLYGDKNQTQYACVHVRTCK